MPDARGYVPVALFQILGRTGKETEPAVRRPRPSLPPPINEPLGSGNGVAMATSAAVANIKRPSIPIGAPISMPMTAHQRSGSLSKNGPMVYGIVMYSFAAERADELEAKAGEAIIVIAQSNPEWFVAKPIGRLGGPGLIPVSFVEIRDMVTGQAIADPADAIKQAGVPRVEEWKQMAADYKNSSITLGKFDSGAATPSSYADQQAQDMQQAISRLSLQQQQQLQQPSAEVIESQKRDQEEQSEQGQDQQRRQQSIDQQKRSQGEQRESGQQQAYRSQQQQQPQQRHMQQRSRDQLQQPQQQGQQRYPDGPNPDYVHDPNSPQETIDPSAIKDLYAPISARVPRYCFAEDKYWFVIEVVLEDGKPWELARYYEDFYDFQIALLNEFPSDAGNTGDNKRTLPYMPGPVSYVTDAITEGRMHNLDSYVKNLLSQPERISRSSLVKQFFAPREGDCEMDPNRRPQDYDNQREENYAAPLLSATTYAPPGQEQGEGGEAMTERQKQKAPANHPDVPIKIKLYFNGDLIAMRLPGDVNFRGLSDRIRQRLRLTERDQLELFYKDEPTGNKPDLLSDNDLNYALQRNEKLMLYAEVV